MDIPTKFLSPNKAGSGSAYAYRIAAVAATAGLLFGFDIAVINGAIVFIRDQFHLSRVSTEVATSSLLLGGAIGAAFAGVLSDRYGRRRILMYSAILFAVSSIGAGLPHALPGFVAARLLAGVATGTASMLAPIYIAENSPPEIRGRLVTFNQLAIVIGILLAYFVNWGLAAAGPQGWRWMFAAAAVPAVLLWIGLRFVPESPRWLVKQGNRKEALRVLQKLLADDIKAESEMQSISLAIEEEKSSHLRWHSPALRRPLLIAVTLAVLQQICGVNTVLYYGSLIFSTQTHSSVSSAVGLNVLIGVVNLVGTLVAIALLDRLGRKPLLLSSAGLMAIALIFLGFAFRMTHLSASLVLPWMLAYIFAFAIGLGPGIWLLMSEMFPTVVRGQMMGVATVALWLASLLLTSTFLSLLQAIGPSGTFWLYAGICVLTVFFILYAAPETKGKTLEEIEKLLSRSND
jgi:SP family arabinose:H+ symporter-like MFS transporter